MTLGTKPLPEPILTFHGWGLVAFTYFPISSVYSYAGAIDSMLDDEEQFADQLKEYYAFGDALRSVCRKQELLQLELEKAEDTLTYKTQQREQLVRMTR